MNKIASSQKQILYDAKTFSLTIFYSNYQHNDEGKEELFRFLEDHKIVDASELGGDELVYMERVFKFCDLHEEILLHTGKVTLRFLGKLVDYISTAEHKDFIHKYYKIKYLHAIR